MSRSIRSAVHDIAERLRNSPSEAYRRADFLGFHHGCSDHAVLFHEDMQESGLWVLGSTRTGKTQRVLACLIVQKIGRNDRMVVIIDLKGDDVLLQTVALEAKRCGRKLFLLNNVSRHATHLFNPLAQRHLRRMSVSSVTELFMNALNLFYGYDYGPFYFSELSSEMFGEGFLMEDGSKGWGAAGKATRATSFVQLAKRLPQVLKRRPELKGAEALIMMVRKLARVFLLNGGCCDLYPAAAVQGEIQLEDLLTPGPNGMFPVLYCYLRAESEPVTSSLIAKMVLNLLKNALRQRVDDIQLGLAPGPAPLVSTFVDECQLVMDTAMENMLEQGASMGMRFVLANQDISQLHKGKRDYLPTVWENCGNKIILSSRDNSFQELLMKLSGEKAVHQLSYLVDGANVSKGKVTPEYSFDGQYQVHELAGPRFARNDLIQMAATPGLGVFFPAQNAPLGQYDGFPILIDVPFLHTAETFARLKETPWPTATPEMVVAHDYMDRWEDYLSQNFK